MFLLMSVHVTMRVLSIQVELSWTFTAKTGMLLSQNISKNITNHLYSCVDKQMRSLEIIKKIFGFAAHVKLACSSVWEKVVRLTVKRMNSSVVTSRNVFMKSMFAIPSWIVWMDLMNTTAVS